MIVHVTNIEWDIKENIPTEELPKEVNFEYEDLCISFFKDMTTAIREKLEKEYGFCVTNFAIDI